MKKFTSLAAALFAVALLSSATVMAQDAASAEAVIVQYHTLVAQYQSQNIDPVKAETMALADIQADIQAMIEAAQDQESKEVILQAALEAAAVLCIVRPGDAKLNLTFTLCNDAVNAVLAAAAAAGMSPDSIIAVAVVSQGIDQDLMAEETASGGGPGSVAGPGASIPGGTGFGGGSGGGGGTASGN